MIDVKVYFIIKSIILIGFLGYFSYEDIRERKITNKAVVIMAIAGAALTLLTMSQRIVINSIICAAVSAAVAFVTELLSRGGLGRGDVLIIGVTGLYIGDLSMLIIVFISLLVLSIFSAVGMLFKKINMKTKLPYIPFLLIGVIIGSLI